MNWDWTGLGEELEAARRACVPRGSPGHDEAAARFHRAWRAVWPPGFSAQLEGCQRGEARALEDVLQFVEACPRFFRSGYVLESALRWLPRPPRTGAQTERIRAVVIDAVRDRLRLPFRRIPSLARAVHSPALRVDLRSLLESADPLARERAARVLDALPGPPDDPERARRRRQDTRAGAMTVTAHRFRSATLLRRTLSLDPQEMTTAGRRYLAAAFEFAMNWDLLPKEELLTVAQRLDGPELEPIWRFALAREDAPGDRARWLLARLRGPGVARG